MNIAQLASDVKEELDGGQSVNLNWLTVARKAGSNLLSKVQGELLRVQNTLVITAESVNKPKLEEGIYCYDMPNLTTGINVEDPTKILDTNGAVVSTFVKWVDFVDENMLDGHFSVMTVNGHSMLVTKDLAPSTDTVYLEGYTTKLFINEDYSWVSEPATNKATINLTASEYMCLLYEACIIAVRGTSQETSRRSVEFKVALDAAYAELSREQPAGHNTFTR